MKILSAALHIRYLWSLLICIYISTSHAVVNVNTVTGTEIPPLDDPGFYNVGLITGGSGVYLGHGWVLTANHVTGTSFTVNATTYASSGPSIRIGDADMRLFRLDALPNLPSLEISATTMNVGTEIIMIGAGRKRAENQSEWWQDSRDNSWTQVEPEPHELRFYTKRTGYTTVNGPATVRWGTNSVSGYGTGDHANDFYTTFDSAAGASEYESQGVRQDSGGVAFYKDESGQWQLVGLMYSVGQYTNQPGGSDTAMFGNRTYFIDLALYRDEILAVIPEPWHSGIVFGLVLFGVALVGSSRRRNSSEKRNFEQSNK